MHLESEGLTEVESGECTERSDPKVLAGHMGREVVLTAALRSRWTLWCSVRHSADFLRRLAAWRRMHYVGPRVAAGRWALQE